MTLSGKALLGVPVDMLRRRLDDPATLAASLPGVEDVEVDGQTLRARVEVATALGRTPFALELALVESQPGRIEVRGGGSGEESAVELAITLELEPRGESTDVSWVADVTLLGVLASVGQRVIASVVSQQMSLALRNAARG